MAGVGAVVTVFFTVLKVCGVEVPAEAGAQVTEAIGTLVGIGLLIWGQIRRPDLIGGIFRRK